jgi:hypothetical protein
MCTVELYETKSYLEVYFLNRLETTPHAAEVTSSNLLFPLLLGSIVAEWDVHLLQVEFQVH